MRTRQEKKLVKFGVASLNKELEVDRFIKMMKQLRIMQKALFTKTELFLINHNRRFVIDSAYHDSKRKLFKKTEDEINPKFLGHYYDSLLRDCNID